MFLHFNVTIFICIYLIVYIIFLVHCKSDLNTHFFILSSNFIGINKSSHQLLCLSSVTLHLQYNVQQSVHFPQLSVNFFFHIFAIFFFFFAIKRGKRIGGSSLSQLEIGVRMIDPYNINHELLFPIEQLKRYLLVDFIQA